MMSPGGRFFLVTGAGLVVFTPGDAPIAQKVAFLVLLLSSGVISLLRLKNVEIKPSRPVLVTAAGLAASLLVAAVDSWAQDPVKTLQNALPFALALFLLPIALDTAQSTSRRTLELGILVVGLIATASFTIHWLNLRGISAFAIADLLASSFLMPAFIFQWGLVTASESAYSPGRRLFGVVISLGVPVALLTTGTRSTIVYAFGVIGFLIWGVTNRRVIRAAASVAIASAVALPLLAFVVSFAVRDSTFLTKRLEMTLQSGVGRDASWQQRQLATQTARSLLEGHWWYGRGLSAPNPLKAFDTPLLPFYRIGVFGTIFFVLFLVVTLRWAFKIASNDVTGNVARGTIVGWTFIVVAQAVLLTPPIDDTLFPFAFIFGVVLAVNSRYLSNASPPGDTAESDSAVAVRSNQIARSPRRPERIRLPA